MSSPKEPAPSPQELARYRAEKCGAELQRVLSQHRCRLQPLVDVRPAGGDGSAVMVHAAYAVVPEA